jgi:hypothetical protein
MCDAFSLGFCLLCFTLFQFYFDALCRQLPESHVSRLKIWQIHVLSYVDTDPTQIQATLHKTGHTKTRSHMTERVKEGS